MRRVAAGIGSALEPFGFEPNPAIMVGDRFVRQWRRTSSWKIDAIDIGHHRDRAIGVEVAFRVLLPCADGAEAWLDGRRLDRILGTEQQEYRFPGLLGKVRVGGCGRLGETIARDVVEGLPWFERFDSPQRCLELLRSGSTAWGKARGKPQRAMSAYLQSLGDGQ